MKLFGANFLKSGERNQSKGLTFVISGKFARGVKDINYHEQILVK